MSKILGVVAVIVSGAALVVSLTSGGSEADEGGAAADAVQREEEADRAADDARLQALELSLSSALKRITALERAQAASAGAGSMPGSASAAGGDTARQIESLRSDVDALLTGEALATEDGRKRFKEVLRQVQDEVFAERARERVVAREQERVDRLKAFFERAGLSASHQEEITRLLDDERQQIQALREGPRTPDRRERMRALRAQTDQAVQRSLNEDQYRQYEAMRQEDRGFGGGGGRRQVPGGPGGRAGDDRRTRGGR